MTTIIINCCTHNKTFSVYDKPNGTIRILEKAGYHLNPVVHAVSEHATDGSCGPSSALTSELLPPKENVIGVKGPSEFFEGREE